jgi:hypothetical protein
LDQLKNAYETGKLTASNELDINAPKISTAAINFISTQPNIIADKLTTDLLNTTKLTVLQQIQNNTPVDQGIKDLENLLNDSIGSASALTSSVITAGGINMGRQSVFDGNPDKIYALQRSEILDERVCNYCVSMDGRVVDKTDNVTQTEQFHFLCRGIWVSIANQETEKPDITGIPTQLRERIGTLQEFKQIPKPLPLPGSLAADFIHNR